MAETVEGDRPVAAVKSVRDMRRRAAQRGNHHRTVLPSDKIRPSFKLHNSSLARPSRERALTDSILTQAQF